MRRCASWVASIAIALTGATAFPDDDPHPSLVPWKVVDVGAEPERAPLVLFWIPTSREELRRSELLASDELTLYASRCVAMRIVRLDDRATLERIGVGGELPAVALTDARGAVIARAEASSVAAVETIVRDELAELAAAAEAKLDEARRKMKAGEVDVAVAIYRDVSAQRCVCPRQGRAAQRALRRLSR